MSEKVLSELYTMFERVMSRLESIESKLDALTPEEPEIPNPPSKEDVECAEALLNTVLIKHDALFNELARLHPDDSQLKALAEQVFGEASRIFTSK
jgi:hypothetical protein